MSAGRTSLLRHRAFVQYLVVNITRFGATQMIAVAVGWQVYAIHRRPFDLGLVGLCEFIPLPLLALPAGQLADRMSRRLVVAISLVIAVVDAVLLLVVTLAGAHSLWPFLVLGSLAGIASSIGSPAARALPPELLPPEDLSAGFALRSTSTQIGNIAGPALGGLLFAIRPELVYIVALGMSLLALYCVLTLPPAVGQVRRGDAPGLEHLFGGISFLRRSRVVLGAILLDLFAVLFGGAVALLPVFARTILHVGPAGLGVLRAAPAAGAIVAGTLLTRRPLTTRNGPKLLGTVVLFGASIVVFGLSKSFALSLVALAVSGFADMVSVNIRSTTVAVATPNHLRGRVNAVENVFISASNQLGAFESGTAAALLGTVPSVVVGGLVTIGIAAVWTQIFPSLSRFDRYEHLQPELADDMPATITP